MLREFWDNLQWELQYTFWDNFIDRCKWRIERLMALYLAHRDWTVIRISPHNITHEDLDRYKFDGTRIFPHFILSVRTYTPAEIEAEKRRGEAADRVNEKYLGDDNVD
jgi:hypothetical protein